MLRGLNPILSPDLLHILRAMGHGDDIVIADANFPAESTGRRVARLDGLSATDVTEAVLSIMPLDSFVDDPAITMQVVDDPQATPPVVEAFQKIIEATADNPAAVKPIERFAFYDRAKAAFAIVQTGEGRLYGNIILKKGVIAP
ncbi:RbsD/FucU family protein [Hoeflea poritis]|uniref:Ribose ABC transporter n=1 Tax=Hoeflea poritis TaxID=2993659 RepID=A0ABT4VVI4_9HYPH|nr:RbsD/FucU domain-containing protein [Hoeflea poritis]MDA4848720.1 ribose ABC transporter [Hoeflea poritis]